MLYFYNQSRLECFSGLLELCQELDLETAQNVNIHAFQHNWLANEKCPLLGQTAFSAPVQGKSSD